MQKKFYITTAIPYLNAGPHLGHALEFVQADVLARYHRLLEEDAFFLTGTDEHGTKIAKTAEGVGKTPQELVDENVQKFLSLLESLQISNDAFIRTSDKEHHWPTVFDIWKRLVEEGDIYKKKYEGLYCYGCEVFVTEKDLIDGKCAIHLRVPEKIEEENYFFKMTRYRDELKRLITSGELHIFPEHRAQEMIYFLDNDFSDTSFSRPKRTLTWGIPVPNDDEATIYVWADALTNYLSGVGYIENKEQFNLFWPPDVQIIGKDILRFHALIWPAILLSAKLPLPKTLFVHGFITHDSQKMSKSLGNVVNPATLIDTYGSDAVRYFFLREIPPTEDGDYNDGKMILRYNSDLAHGIGNLVSRITTLAEKNGSVILEQFDGQAEVDIYWKRYHDAMNTFRFNETLEVVWGLIAYVDRELTQKKLWSHPDNKTLSDLTHYLINLGWMLTPFLPHTADLLINAILGHELEFRDKWLGISVSVKKIGLFPKKEA
ncbi:MAG: methionine--tRNA ligase [Parcubacteria group bacterium]|nr:methionine--tRNA ligase [Parcubacteria group bacterium]